MNSKNHVLNHNTNSVVTKSDVKIEDNTRISIADISKTMHEEKEMVTFFCLVRNVSRGHTVDSFYKFDCFDDANSLKDSIEFTVWSPKTIIKDNSYYTIKNCFIKKTDSVFCTTSEFTEFVFERKFDETEVTIDDDEVFNISQSTLNICYVSSFTEIEEKKDHFNNYSMNGKNIFLLAYQ